MQGEAANFDVLPKEPRCHRRLGEPTMMMMMMPASDVYNLCTATVEKRIRQEEAWALQGSLQDGLSRFQDWLWAAESVAASPRTSQVSCADAKKELQKFRALQKDISEKVWALESLNRQYHRLVRMGGLRPGPRSSVQGINRRWEELHTRAAAVSRRLQHFARQWEEFGQEKEAVQVRLMELDLRLTDLEHFSAGTALDKMIQLQAFRQDVQANTEGVDRLLVCAENLIQKSQPEDAETLEEDLKELVGFHQAVFSRVFQFQRRLVSMRLVFEDEWQSERESDSDSDCSTEGSLPFRTGDPEPAARIPEAPLCRSSPKPACRCRELAPVGGPSGTDLEWDPSVDVGGSTSQDEDSSYCSAAMGFGQGEHHRRRCHSLRRSCGRTEEFSVQGSFPEEGEPCRCPPGSGLLKTDIWGHPAPQEPGAAQLPQGGVCGPPAEATGFDPKRVETWLDQNCQNQMGTLSEVEEHNSQGRPFKDSAAHVDELPPAEELQPPLRIQTRGGGQARRQKAQPWSERKSRRSPLPSRPWWERQRRISKSAPLNSQSAEIVVSIEKECDLQLPTEMSARPQTLRRASILWLFLSSIFAVLVWLLCHTTFLPFSQPPCLQTNSLAKSFHLMLKYEGPPPT